MNKQKSVELEVCKYYWKLYRKRENGKQMTMIEKRIDEIQNSNKEEDIQELEKCKTELQDLVDKKDSEEARKSLSKYNLEGKRPTKFFCSLKKK